MQKALIIIISIILFMLISLAIRAYLSRNAVAPGIRDAKLVTCPKSNNCVCSEFLSDTRHYIEPLKVKNLSTSDSMQDIRKLVEEIGGKVQSADANYLSATVTSSVFQFIDDIEFRLSDNKTTIHIRSASRVGRSDLGANRKRMENIRTLWRASQPSSTEIESEGQN